MRSPKKQTRQEIGGFHIYIKCGIAIVRKEGVPLKTYIFVFSCDLERHQGKHIPGRITRKTCDQAIQILSEIPNSAIIATAGYSKKHRCFVAQDSIARYMRERGIKNYRSGCSEFCDTDGEVVEFLRLMSREAGEARIIVVNKWWHIPRTWMLFQLRMDGRLRKKLYFKYCPVSSFHPGWILRELIAIPHNLIRRFVRGNETINGC